MREPTPKEATSDETGATASVGQPDGHPRSGRKLIRELDGPVDEDFRKSMAGLSQRLAERATGQPTADPKAAVAARKAALLAYDLEQAHRLRATLKIVGAGALSVAIAAAVVILASPFERPSLGSSTFTKPAPAEVAAVAPVAPVAPIAPAAPAANPPVSAAPPPPPAAAPITVQAEPPPSPILETAAAPSDLEPSPLHQNEVREVQSRLRGFGFNPGPIDGVAGTLTQAAVTSYQQSRDLQQTGILDRDLLEQLRRDPAPEVVPPPVQRAARPTRQPRSQDPIRAIGQDFERWLRSL